MIARILGLFCLVTLLVAPAALAQTIDSRFGALRVVDASDGSQYLASGNRALAGTDGWRLYPQFVIPWRETTDVVVMFVATGGNACAGQFQFIAMSEDRAPRASAQVGTCSDLINRLRVNSDAIEIDIPAATARLERVTLRFDGRTASEIAVPRTEDDAVAAGPGQDVRRWHQKYPYEILADPSERMRFREIMGSEAVLTMMDLISVASPASVSNGVLFATGCRPHECGDYGAAFAVDVATGRPYAAMHDEAGVRVYGGRLRDLPRQLRDYVRSRRN